MLMKKVYVITTRAFWKGTLFKRLAETKVMTDKEAARDFFNHEYQDIRGWFFDGDEPYEMKLLDENTVEFYNSEVYAIVQFVEVVVE